MAMELAFALINPYSIAKSRTGGIIGRFMSRTGLELVAARMFGPSEDLVRRYADQIRNDIEKDEKIRNILADYILRAYMPDADTGRRHRVMMLLFEGENAIEKICKCAGPLRPNMEAGETVRDTYGDFILGEDGSLRYIEPAVLVGQTPQSSKATMQLWASYAAQDGGVLEGSRDVPEKDIQKTLVLIKPDNFKFPNSRPGNIIDIFSRSGLRIVGAKVHRLSVSQAEEFYGPVREILRKKLNSLVAERSAKVLSAELGMELPEDLKTQLGTQLGPLYGDHQFFSIIHFMTGRWAAQCTAEQKQEPGDERSLALVYSGVNAVEKIRGILGSTDPSKAEQGSVRREFGSNILVNAAHASDTPENAQRELRIVKVEEDTIQRWVAKYYP